MFEYLGALVGAVLLALVVCVGVYLCKLLHILSWPFRRCGLCLAQRFDHVPDNVTVV